MRWGPSGRWALYHGSGSCGLGVFPEDRKWLFSAGRAGGTAWGGMSRQQAWPVAMSCTGIPQNSSHSCGSHFVRFWTNTSSASMVKCKTVVSLGLFLLCSRATVTSSSPIWTTSSQPLPFRRPQRCINLEILHHQMHISLLISNTTTSVPISMRNLQKSSLP